MGVGGEVVVGMGEGVPVGLSVIVFDKVGIRVGVGLAVRVGVAVNGVQLGVRDAERVKVGEGVKLKVTVIAGV